MSNIGNFPAAQTVRHLFSTAVNGGPTALVGAVISIYKKGNATQVVTGVTLTVGYDSVTGLNELIVVTSDAFYVAGEDYVAVLTVGTLGGISVVGRTVMEWSIVNRDRTATNLAGDPLATSAQSVVIAAAIVALPAAPSANANADALLDRANAIDGKTPREAWRIIAATTSGKIVTAGESIEIFLGLDGVTERVRSTNDADGNRTPVAYP